jgi:hypothetical protein
MQFVDKSSLSQCTFAKQDIRGKHVFDTGSIFVKCYFFLNNETNHAFRARLYLLNGIENFFPKFFYYSGGIRTLAFQTLDHFE